MWVPENIAHGKTDDRTAVSQNIYGYYTTYAADHKILNNIFIYEKHSYSSYLSKDFASFFISSYVTESSHAIINTSLSFPTS